MSRSTTVATGRPAGVGTVAVANASALSGPVPFLATVTRNGAPVTQLSVIDVDTVANTLAVGSTPGVPDASLFVGDTIITKSIGTVLTGVVVASHTGPITVDVDGSTITFDVSGNDWHTVTLGGNRTLAVANVATNQQFTIVLVQDATGSRTVTWWSGIKWAGGSPPTLTTSAGKADIFTFKQIASGSYYGFVAGQNL